MAKKKKIVGIIGLNGEIQKIKDEDNKDNKKNANTKLNIVGSVDSDGNITRYNDSENKTSGISNSRSRMKESHLQRYNLDGTPKIPIADSITNKNIITLGEKNKLTNSFQNSISQKIVNGNQQATPKIDLSGKSYLQDTGKTYGDYYYDNYSQNKDKKIYVNTKDGNYFLDNNGKYEKLGTGLTSNINTMTTKSAEDKKIKEAKKQGYKGNQSSQKLEKYLNEVSKKTGFTNEELYTIASDYENGKWKPASSKYAEISSRLNKAGYQGYEVANKINKLKKESTQDINTTITNEVFPQEQIPWYKKIIKGSEAFNDGYDVGDITKTVVATAQDIGANIGEGFLGTVEGISDTLQYGSADLMDLFKKKAAAKAIRENAKFNSTAAIFGKNEKEEDNFVKGWTEKVDKNSIAGQGLDSISQGVGNIGAFVGASYLTGGSSASSFLTTFSSAYGNAKSNAYQNGATDKTATETAIVSGLAEAISEQFFDKIPGMKTQGWGEKLVGKVGSKAEKYFGTKTGKVVMNILDNSGEGFEEIISDILNTTGNNIVHTIDKDYNGNLSLQTDTWLESFVYASITSALVNGGNTVLTNTQKNQILKAYAEENNMTLSQAKSVLNQETQLRTDNIETNDLRERTNTEKETQKQVLNEMKQNTYTADERVSIPQEVQQEVRQEVTEDVQEQPNDKTVSVREVNKLISDTIKKSTLEYNAKEITELRKTIYDEYKKLGVEIQESKNFIESAKENNFNTETEEIKSVAKMLNAREIESKFDPTYFKDKSEAAIWTINEDGKRSVIFNPDAKESTIFQNVAVHELTHDLLSSENSAEQLDKQDLLTYISKTENYEEARRALEDAYARVYDRNSSEFKNLVDEEAIASVLGSKLGNQEFINRLNGERPNLARRIYNWVVDKIDNLGKSAEYKQEKKYWKEVANRFEKAFNMEYNRGTNGADTRFAKSTNDNLKFKTIQEAVEDDPRKKSFVKYNTSIDLFNLDYKDMKRVISIGSKYALEAQRLGFDNYTFNDDNYNYDFKIINKKNNAFGITHMEAIDNSVRRDVNERIEKQNNRLPNRNSTHEEGYNDSNIESIKNRESSKENAKLPTRKQKQQTTNENRQSIKDKKNNSRELDNSSFSHTKDNQGRTLSKQQQEYFKDSKVRDDEGNLMVMYHGTPNDFTIFDTKKFGGANGTAEGFGIYLTDNIEVADDYLYADKGKVMNLYANITKPATTNELTINKQDVIRTIKELTKKDAQEMVNDGDYDNIQDALKDTWISNYTYTYDKSIEQSYDDVASIILDNSENDFEVLQELMNGSGNNDYKNAESFYNIITDTLGFDGIQTKWDFKDTELKQKNANILIAFKSNQVKSVDNTNPTKNDDIRYSQDTGKWETFVNKNFSSKGKTTTFGELKNKVDNIPISKKYEEVKQEEKPKSKVKEKDTIEERIEKNEQTLKISQMSDNKLKETSKTIAEQINKDGGLTLKQRKWISTSTESEILDNAVSIEDLDPNKIYYTPIGNKTTLDKANKNLNKLGYEDSIKYIQNKLSTGERISASDVALSERLIQEAVKKGDTKTAQELIMDTAILGTEYGQTIQALSIIQKLTPEGQLKMLDKIVMREKSKGNKTFEGVEITPEMIEKILKAYSKDGTYNQDDLNRRVEEVKQEIADQLKTTVGEKIDAWRYLSMLGNPKTHIRNIVSNVAMKGAIKYKNALARTMETIIPIKNRTKTWKKSSKVVNEFAKQKATELREVISGETKYSEKTSIEAKKQIFKTKFLDKLYNTNSALLDVEDWLFSKSAFESTFREYLTAHDIKTQKDIDNNPTIVEKAQNYAIEQAQIATFRQYSKIASQINKFERNNKMGGFLTKAVVPFKKTPINIAKAGVNYSPLGLIKNLSYDIIQVKKGNIEASQYIDNLSQGLSGSSIALLGYVLSKAGILKGDDDKDKESKYDSALGNKAYSLKIGNDYYSLSWLSPVGMPLFVGANAYKELEENKNIDMNVVSDMLVSTLNPISEMSLVSGLTDTLTSYEGESSKIMGEIAKSSLKSYVGQFFPTLLSQIASVTDSEKRSTTPSSNSKWKYGEEVLNSIKYKIPFARQTLSTYTDLWGNTQKQADNIVMRAWETFIAPYSRYDNKKKKLDEEIQEVYYKTGNIDVIPGTPNSSITLNKEKYRLSNKEYLQFKKTYGTTANNYIEAIIKNSDYKKATYEDKAKIIDRVYDYALTNAQTEYFKKQKIDMSNYGHKSISNKLDMFKEENYSYDDIADYIIYNYYKYKRD